MTFTDPGETQPEPVVDTAAQERTAALERENVFLRAGVDLAAAAKDPKLQMVVDSLQGVPTADLKPEGIQARLVLAGVGEEESPASEPERLPGEEGQGAERVSLGNAGVVEPNPADLDPRVEAARLAGEARQKGGTADDVIATGFHAIAVAGYENKDARVFATDNG